MKRHIRVLTVLLLTLAVLAAAFWALESRRKADWRIALDVYTQYQSRLSKSKFVIRKTVHASGPYNFDKNLSGPTWSDRPYFQVDHTYSGQSAARLKPLPYPPGDLWCALIEQNTRYSDNTNVTHRRQIVFVALYQDLYFSQWVVHEMINDPPAGGEPGPPEFPEILAGVGCTQLLDWLERGGQEVMLPKTSREMLACDS